MITTKNISDDRFPSQKTYKLWQKVRVKMIDCDEISRTIDFRLVKERKEEREDG